MEQKLTFKDLWEKHNEQTEKLNEEIGKIDVEKLKEEIDRNNLDIKENEKKVLRVDARIVHLKEQLEKINELSKQYGMELGIESAKFECEKNIEEAQKYMAELVDKIGKLQNVNKEHETKISRFNSKDEEQKKIDEAIIKEAEDRKENTKHNLLKEKKKLEKKIEELNNEIEIYGVNLGKDAGKHLTSQEEIVISKINEKIGKLTEEINGIDKKIEINEKKFNLFKENLGKNKRKIKDKQEEKKQEPKTVPPQPEPVKTEPVKTEPEQKAPQQKAPQQKVPQQTAPEQTVPQPKAPQPKAPQQTAPQQTAPQPKAPQPEPVKTEPEQKAPQQKAPQQKAPHQKVPQQTAPEQTVPQPKAPQPKAPQQTAPQQTTPKQEEVQSIEGFGLTQEELEIIVKAWNWTKEKREIYRDQNGNLIEQKILGQINPASMDEVANTIGRIINLRRTKLKDGKIDKIGFLTQDELKKFIELENNQKFLDENGDISEEKVLDYLLEGKLPIDMDENMYLIGRTILHRVQEKQKETEEQIDEKTAQQPEEVQSIEGFSQADLRFITSAWGKEEEESCIDENGDLIEQKVLELVAEKGTAAAKPIGNIIAVRRRGLKDGTRDKIALFTEDALKEFVEFFSKDQLLDEKGNISEELLDEKGNISEEKVVDYYFGIKDENKREILIAQLGRLAVECRLQDKTKEVAEQKEASLYDVQLPNIQVKVDAATNTIVIEGISRNGEEYSDSLSLNYDKENMQELRETILKEYGLDDNSRIDSNVLAILHKAGCEREIEEYVYTMSNPADARTLYTFDLSYNLDNIHGLDTMSGSEKRNISKLARQAQKRAGAEVSRKGNSIFERIASWVTSKLPKQWIQAIKGGEKVYAIAEESSSHEHGIDNKQTTFDSKNVDQVKDNVTTSKKINVDAGNRGEVKQGAQTEPSKTTGEHNLDSNDDGEYFFGPSHDDDDDDDYSRDDKKDDSKPRKRRNETLIQKLVKKLKTPMPKKGKNSSKADLDVDSKSETSTVATRKTPKEYLSESNPNFVQSVNTEAALESAGVDEKGQLVPITDKDGNTTYGTRGTTEVIK